MTKVEELRELRNALDDLIETEATKILTAHQFLELPGFDKIMDAIVAVARAEGVAEGAEQTLKKLREVAYEPSSHWAKDMGYQRGAAVIVTKFDLGLNNDGSVLVPKEADND